MKRSYNSKTTRKEDSAMKKKIQNLHPGFSVAELLLSLLVVMVVAVALAPIIGPKKLKVPRWHAPHGTFQCYYYLREGTPTLHQYSVIDGNVVDVDVAGSDHCTFENIPEASLYEVYAVGEGTDAVPEASLIEATGEMADMYYQEGMVHDTEYAQQSFQLFNSENNNAYDEESNPNGVHNISTLNHMHDIRQARDYRSERPISRNIIDLLDRLGNGYADASGTNTVNPFGLYLFLDEVATPTAQPGMSRVAMKTKLSEQCDYRAYINYFDDNCREYLPPTGESFTNLAGGLMDKLESPYKFLYLFQQGGDGGAQYVSTGALLPITSDQSIRGSVLNTVIEYRLDDLTAVGNIRFEIPITMPSFRIGAADSGLTYTRPTSGTYSDAYDAEIQGFTGSPTSGNDGECIEDEDGGAQCNGTTNTAISAVTADEFYERSNRSICPTYGYAGFCIDQSIDLSSNPGYGLLRTRKQAEPGHVDVRPNAFGWAYRPLMSRVKIGGKGERGREGIYKGDKLRGPLLLYPEGGSNARSKAVRVEGEAETIIAQAPEAEVPAANFKQVEDTFNPSSNKPTEAQIDFADPHNEQLKYRYAIEGIGEPDRGVAGLCREQHRCPGFGGGGYFPIFHYHAYALDSSATELGDPQEYSPYLELILGDNVASTYAFFTTTRQGQRHILRYSLNIPAHTELYSDEDCGAGRSYMVDTAGGGRAHDICRIYSGDNPLYVNGHGLGAVIVVW